jgi:hypothetical protein
VPAGTAATIAATRPCKAAESETISVSNSSDSRFDITATPWSPIVPESSTRRPAAPCRRKIEAVRHDADAGGGDEHAVGLAALDDLGVAGDDRHAGQRAPPRPSLSAMRCRSASAKPSSMMKLAAR